MRDCLRDILREDATRSLSGLVERLAPLRGGHLLVTGGTGFMGAWVAEAVACLNDLFCFGLRLTLLARQSAAFRDKAPHLASRSDMVLADKDVQSLVELPEDTQWVIHAAGNPDSRQHATDPLKTARAIMVGTDAVLEACTRLPRLKAALLVSSGLIYGPQPLDVERQTESQFHGVDPSALSAAYIEAKRASETLAAIYRSQHRVPLVIARPFAFIGPYQLLDRPWAVNNFLRDGLAQSPIRVLGDGETVRSYMYGADMAAWLLRMLCGGERGAAYNLGSPEAVTLRDLAGKLGKTGGAREVILGVGGPTAARRSRLVPDVTKAEGLGLSLCFSLDEAVQRTVRWHRAL